MDDPTKQQYIIFAAIVSLIVAIFLNFTVIGAIPGLFVQGFPLNAFGATGVGLFFIRIVNSLVMGALLVVPMYYFLQWILKKMGSY
jgi:hypothetical protein